ncbi:hypothetical protein [Cypionkella sp.]|uniref:hypothetical protein n=1 Tax=Cypionkella sp. TaxID=2811411 RepID=UPI002AB8A054|nr:hypothetical protein [Cypionkella sp.]MDZ4393788.1 hypothetical protein [Cypionkella sp.]
MPSIDQMIKAEVRSLARKGKLIDTAFKMFRQQVFPDAAPDAIAVMRTCFFAGCAEVYAVMSSGMDDGLAETDGDLRFMEQWVAEVEQFHARTIATSTATGKAQ